METFKSFLENPIMTIIGYVVAFLGGIVIIRSAWKSSRPVLKWMGLVFGVLGTIAITLSLIVDCVSLII